MGGGGWGGGVRFLSSEHVQEAIEQFLCSAVATTLEVERRHAQAKRCIEARKVAHIAAASRNAMLRRLQARSAATSAAIKAAEAEKTKSQLYEVDIVGVARATASRARREAIREALPQRLRPRCLEGARPCRPRAVPCGLAGGAGPSRWARGRSNQRGLGAVERRGLGGALGRQGGLIQGTLGHRDHGAAKSQPFADSATAATTRRGEQDPIE